MGKDDRGGGRDTGSTAEYKKRATAHQAVTPNHCSDRAAANTKRAQVCSPGLQAYIWVGNQLALQKGSPVMQNTLSHK